MAAPPLIHKKTDSSAEVRDSRLRKLMAFARNRTFPKHLLFQPSPRVGQACARLSGHLHVNVSLHALHRGLTRQGDNQRLLADRLEGCTERLLTAVAQEKLGRAG